MTTSDTIRPITELFADQRPQLIADFYMDGASNCPRRDQRVYRLGAHHYRLAFKHPTTGRWVFNNDVTFTTVDAAINLALINLGFGDERQRRAT